MNSNDKVIKKSARSQRSAKDEVDQAHLASLAKDLAFRDNFLDHKLTLIKFVPPVAAGMCFIAFVAPFVLMYLKACCPAWECMPAVYLVSINVPLFGIAGGLMALFLRAAESGKRELNEGHHILKSTDQIQ